MSYGPFWCELGRENLERVRSDQLLSGPTVYAYKQGTRHTNPTQKARALQTTVIEFSTETQPSGVLSPRHDYQVLWHLRSGTQLPICLRQVFHPDGRIEPLH